VRHPHLRVVAIAPTAVFVIDAKNHGVRKVSVTASLTREA